MLTGNLADHKKNGGRKTVSDEESNLMREAAVVTKSAKLGDVDIDNFEL